MDEEKKIKEFITENKFWIKCGIVVLAMLGLLFIGFELGRAYSNKHLEPKIEIRYEKGDSIRVEVPTPVPYEVVKPIDTTNFLIGLIASGVYQEIMPTKRDTVFIEVPTPTSEDTLAVVRDYTTKRIYNELFFDNDTLGKMQFHGEVQYNRLRYYGYTFTPAIKTVTETNYVIRKFSPYVGAGISSQPTAIVQAGAFFDEKYGVAVQYNYDWQLKKNDFGALFMYKF